MESLERLVDYLRQHGITLATAESCTAGQIVSELARIPGSGQSIDCGLAVYSPESKNRYLGVRRATIDTYGLTSEAVSREMALGAINNNAADFAVANTGVAGPASADDGTPPGTLCFAWACRDADGSVQLFSETCHFDGDRNQVRLEAAHYALQRIPHYHQRVFSDQPAHDNPE